MNIERFSYWDKFYGSKGVGSLLKPSQFAAFVLGEVPEATHLIEVGCGNGRDADFFASFGLAVTALDASESAITLCLERNRGRNIRFAKFALGDPIDSIMTRTEETGSKTIFYARFFLHAITDEEERIFFSVARHLTQRGSVLALEYRSAGDEQNAKEFGQHYRRFLRHADLCKRVGDAGFEITYEIEGKGLAKYKSEDALVGRCVAVRT